MANNRLGSIGRLLLKPQTRALVALVAVAVVASNYSPGHAHAGVGRPQSCDNPGKAITLFAERLGPNKVGYGYTPNTASIPGPTIQMYEGDCLSITLVNDADKPVSLHVHGVAYTPASDGTSLNNGCVSPGHSTTYVWHALTQRTRSDGTIAAGSAGYWPYHDHCMGTPHGTGGIDSGLWGALIVRRQGDLVPDVPPFVVVMGPGATIDLRKAPHTPIFKANEGQRVEFVVIGMGNDFHTFHLHAHRWFDTRTGYITDPSETNVPVIDNKTVGPADSFGFQVIAGEDTGPGAWMYHCHVQFHSDMGMVGIFEVRNPDGSETPQEVAAIKKWRKQEKMMRQMDMTGGSQ